MHATIENTFAALEDQALLPGASCAALLADAHREVSRHTTRTKTHLLGSSLMWTDEEKAQAATLHTLHHRFARLAARVCEALCKGVTDTPALGTALALALYYEGEAVKCQITSRSAIAHEYPAMHGLMRIAMAHGLQRLRIGLEVEAQTLACTLEGLYFRALTLARFGGGPLSDKQIEIMDTWICMWLPELEAVSQAPTDTALRADLDSDHGLRHGPRADPGESLYLPNDLVQQAHDTVVKALHAGRIVPEHGLVSTFRIEEHMAVLAMIRRGMRVARRQRVARAERRATGQIVEMHVGLGEVMGRALQPAAPVAGALMLATRDGARVEPGRLERDRDVIPQEFFEPARRSVLLLDESGTGFGIEASADDCGHVSVGDLVAFKLHGSAPLTLCRITRAVPAARSGRVRLGAQRLSSSSRLVWARRGPDEAPQPMLFLLGADASGRHDGFLVADAEFNRGGRLGVETRGRAFRLSLNRIRERGRGWVMAGFEVLGLGETGGWVEVA